jgi:hypothetical protein
MKGLRDKVSPEEAKFLDFIVNVDRLRYRRAKRLLKIKYKLREYRLVYLLNNLKKGFYRNFKNN